jgi:hypothetical protein
MLFRVSRNVKFMQVLRLWAEGRKRAGLSAVSRAGYLHSPAIAKGISIRRIFPDRGAGQGRIY